MTIPAIPLVAPVQFDIYKSLRLFLNSVLPPDTDVIRGQANRVPEPEHDDFVIMTEIRRSRFATNINDFVDTRFIGSIAAGTLTVETLDYGGLHLGSVIFGVGILDRTYITQMIPPANGSVGQYVIANPPQSLSSRVLAAGQFDAMQKTEVTVQLDVHGPNSADNAARISTTFRDEYATHAFSTYGSDVQPLYADEPKQIPFINENNQYEDRWIIEACMQANVVVTIPQQFFETAIVGLIEVDTHYPP